ncbi:MAG: heparan-alpha-glucosaminide N-acetyltransferase domain-containing protein [Xanthomonadales bacterium]|nr:heparan-alpha-glucosaminide N-acetyltransferase domain-containing protein [Xanthomonadales bacterium]
MQTLDTKFRFDSIDQLRGLVMVLMALDHVRDYYAPFPHDPLALDQTSPELFMTRWITHLCAPVFIFLTGMSAFLFQSKGNSRATVRNFLLTRGLWLIFIELTVVNLSWKFNFAPWFFIQVIWAIGVSMLVLALLIYLPRVAIMAFGLVLIAGHNLLDGIDAAQFGDFAWLWGILHQQMWVPFNEQGAGVWIAYPLIPWIGVIAVGYASANWFLREPEEFASRCIKAGMVISAAFLVLRGINLYGDPAPWAAQPRGLLFSVLAFIDTEKYPPSLLYLMMTLGPSLVLLGLFQRGRALPGRPLVLFGRVPFFFYVLHLPLIHASSIAYFWLTGVGLHQGWQLGPPNGWPPAYEPSLLRCYIAWTAITVVMYFLCRWFAGVKQRHDHWVLKYL